MRNFFLILMCSMSLIMANTIVVFAESDNPIVIIGDTYEGTSVVQAMELLQATDNSVIIVGSGDIGTSIGLDLSELNSTDNPKIIIVNGNTHRDLSLLTNLNELHSLPKFIFSSYDYDIFLYLEQSGYVFYEYRDQEKTINPKVIYLPCYYTNGKYCIRSQLDCKC